MKIAVLTLAIGEKYREAVKIGIDSKIDYCRKNNYTFILGGEEIYDKIRPIAWSKIKLIEKYINDYDYIFCSDADVVIMNDNIKLEELISKYMTNSIKLLVTKDWQNINTGNIIVKNCCEIKKLLVDIYKQTQFINTGWWEQSAFINLYNNNSYIKEYTKVLTNSHLINAYIIQFKDYPLPENNKYRTGDFLIHLAGVDNINDIKNIMKICRDIKEKEKLYGFNNYVIVNID
jgi:hypothetical protein